MTPIKQIFPPASDRKIWLDALKKDHNKKLKRVIMGKAGELINAPIPEITASLFMNFVRNGNRKKYETPYFQRRRNLSTLAIAESFEYKGKYIDRIIDYIWEIISEPTWCVPAHCRLEKDPFPEFPVEIVDLFNSETGMVLALTMNLLEEEIKAVSPNFIKLIRNEIIKRIALPLETGPAPFWYEGINNWTTWCCNNALGAIIWALREEPERQRKLAETLHNAIKNYISRYPEDGFCFEGPGYWAVSPGRLLYFLEQLNFWHSEPKVKAMAEYIADTRMSSSRNMNFGDNFSKGNHCPWIIYRFGERVGSEPLKIMALECLNNVNYETLCSELFNILGFVFWLPGKGKRKKFTGKPISFYDKTQFFVMRQNGTVLAAKRGHAWSHHHLDIGHFMLFFKEEPIIIDRGKPEYTKDTFTDKRFLNDIMNNEGHNIPLFNGIGQLELAPPAPGAMSYQEEKESIRCRMDLTTAYAPEAKLKSYIRELVFDRKTNTLNVSDSWETESDQNEVRANFFTPAKVIQRDGKLFIGSVEVKAEGCEMTVEKIKITDSSQLYDWGKSLTRIQLRKNTGKQGKWLVSFLMK